MDGVVSNEAIEIFEELLNRLPTHVSSFDEADMYAVKFLKGAGLVNTTLRHARNAVIPLKQLKEIEFAQACTRSNGKTGEAQKRQAALDVLYQAAEQKYLEGANMCEYLDNLYKIFVKAHEYYKGVAREK